MLRKFNPKFCKIVHILNDGICHDGASIGRIVGITRSAVWKSIKKLQSYGISIDSIKGKGYVMSKPLILLDPKRIHTDLNNKKLNLIVLESVDSTNTYLKSIKKKENAPQICIAEEQTQGKGRLGRTWYAPFGKNIYLSCAYTIQKDMSELGALSLVVGLAIQKLLKSYGINKGLFVKWPNDLIYQNKKLAGHLIEIQAESHGACQVIIGIGINVNLEGVQKHILQPWTSLHKILKCHIDRNELCARLLNGLFDFLYRFQELGFASFQEEWTSADYLRHQKICLKNAGQILVGEARGVDARGHLILKLMDGTEKLISSGDATLIRDFKDSSR